MIVVFFVVILGVRHPYFQFTLCFMVEKKLNMDLKQYEGE